MIRFWEEFLVVVFISMSVFIQPCFTAGEEPQTSKPVALKVVRFPFLSYGPIFIAKEEGFFTEQGLEVEFLNMKESTALQALALGNIDVWADIFTIGSLNAILRSADIRLVSDKGHFAADGCPSFGLIARKDLAQILDAGVRQQLKGRRFDVLAGSFEEYFVDKILSRAGPKPDEVVKLNVPQPPQMVAFVKGRLDFAVTFDPWVNRYKRSGHAVLLTGVQEVIPDFNYAFMRFGPSLLKKNPKAGRRFMVAFLKGLRQYNQG